MNIHLTINNEPYSIKVHPDEMLVETLRKLQFYSVKKGCDSTSCGVCVVLVNNKPVPSCSFLSVRADGMNITTVEGIAEEAKHFSVLLGHEGGDQCGFCNPSLALTVYSMKLTDKKYSHDEIKDYLVGNLCRCTGYQSQEIAIMKYLEVIS